MKYLSISAAIILFVAAIFMVWPPFQTESKVSTSPRLQLTINPATDTPGYAIRETTIQSKANKLQELNKANNRYCKAIALEVDSLHQSLQTDAVLSATPTILKLLDTLPIAEPRTVNTSK